LRLTSAAWVAIAHNLSAYKTHSSARFHSVTPRLFCADAERTAQLCFPPGQQFFLSACTTIAAPAVLRQPHQSSWSETPQGIDACLNRGEVVKHSQVIRSLASSDRRCASRAADVSASCFCSNRSPLPIWMKATFLRLTLVFF